ncbi:MAG: ankyrin repeat domain-containing protein [Pyrinomonadaceae bacterium]
MKNKFAQKFLLVAALLSASPAFSISGHAQSVKSAGSQTEGEKEKLLFKAIKERNLDSVKKLIAAKADVNARDEEEKTTLQQAAENYLPGGEILKALIAGGAEVKWGGVEALRMQQANQAEIIKILIKAGFNVNSSDAKGNTAIFYTDAENLDLLIGAGSNVNAKNTDGRTPLLETGGDLNTIKKLIAAKANVNDQDNDGDTVLMLSARFGNVDAIKALYEAGAKINLKDEAGRTALDHAIANLKATPPGSQKETQETIKFLESVGGKTGNSIEKRPPDEKAKLLFKAVESGDLDAVKKLIAAGVNVKAKKDGDGKTPLIVAAENFVEDGVILKALIDAGADLKRDELEAIKSATDDDQHEVVKFLIKSGFDVNKRDSLGRTALFDAAAAAMKLLIAAGAYVNVRDEDGMTPLMAAGKLEEAKILVAAGANVNEKDANGDTPLMFAADGGNIDVIKALIAAGAKLNAKNKKGQTALMKASENARSAPTDTNWKEVIQLLTSAGAVKAKQP